MLIYKPQIGRQTGRPGTTGRIGNSMPKDSASTVEGSHIQFGALCWRIGKKGAEVLLISSRETGRWVIPKGWPMEGRAGHEAAAIEAWEEAGVTGKIAEDRLGNFSYDKILSRDSRNERAKPCSVDVYPLEVVKLAPEFPEQRQRRRKWFAPADAARKVAEPELKSILAVFNPSCQAAAAAMRKDSKD